MMGPDQETRQSPPELPADLVCELLACEVRRRLLLILHEDGSTTIERIARVVAAETPSADRDAIEAQWICLHHHHLPKLADAEMIAFTEGNERVRLTERGDALVAALLESPLPA